MLNFTVGPVMMNEEILKIGAQQLPYFRTERFSELMLENEKMLIQATEAEDDARVIFLTASGTGAMEAAIMNLFTQDDKLLVIEGGSFGARFKSLCEIHEIPTDSIVIEHGVNITEEDLIPYEQKGYTGLLVNAHETSTGVLYNMELLAAFCKRNHIFFLVDAISSFLADPFHMKKWGVNAMILSSQKALAIPAGMSFVVLDQDAQKRVESRELHHMYFDFKRYMADGKRGQTPFTPAVSVLHQLNRRLKTLMNRGVEQECSKTAIVAEQFRRGIKGLPLEISSKSCSNALTALRVKGKMTAIEIIQYLAIHYDIYINPCSGDEKDTHIRVGHIGEISNEQMDQLLNAFYDMKQKEVL